MIEMIDSSVVLKPIAAAGMILGGGSWISLSLGGPIPSSTIIHVTLVVTALAMFATSYDLLFRERDQREYL